MTLLVLNNRALGGKICVTCMPGVGFSIQSFLSCDQENSKVDIKYSTLNVFVSNKFY